jgi:hypothetical protein
MISTVRFALTGRLAYFRFFTDETTRDRIFCAALTLPVPLFHNESRPDRGGR